MVPNPFVYKPQFITTRGAAAIVNAVVCTRTIGVLFVLGGSLASLKGSHRVRQFPSVDPLAPAPIRSKGYVLQHPENSWEEEREGQRRYTL